MLSLFVFLIVHHVKSIVKVFAVVTFPISPKVVALFFAGYEAEAYLLEG